MPRKRKLFSGLRTGSHSMRVLLLALGFALGISWLVAGQLQSTSSREALQHQRAHTTRLYQLDQLLLKLLDAEAGVRGYLLTENPVYLAPYQNGRAEAEEIFGLLITPDEWRGETTGELLARLPALYQQRWEVMRVALERGAPGDSSSALGGLGKQLSDEIRAIIEELRGRTREDIDRSLLASFSRFTEMHDLNRLLGGGALLLLLWLAITLHREEKLRARIDHLLTTENDRLNAEVEARTVELTNLATYLTNIRELDNVRVAHELHDDVGPLLTAAKIDASWVARRLPDDAMAPLRKRFERLIGTLDQVIGIKRRVVADLRPPVLAELGLVAALRTLAQTAVGEADDKVEVEMPDTLDEPSPQVSLAVFRIAQESLANVRKHASASRTRLTLRQDTDALVLRVEDDGEGFEPSVGPSRDRGLAGIAHRVHVLGGSLAVDSVRGRGTSVTARIPWPSESGGVVPVQTRRGDREHGV